MHENVEAERVYQLLQTLPPDYREALVLLFQEGLSVGELASALGVSVSGDKMRVHRGLTRLRELLEGETHEK